MSEPAFPSNIAQNDFNLKHGLHTGMTLRDYFAGQALIGLVKDSPSFEQTAHQAYMAADKMMEKRKQCT